MVESFQRQFRDATSAAAESDTSRSFLLRRALFEQELRHQQQDQQKHQQQQKHSLLQEQKSSQVEHYDIGSKKLRSKVVPRPPQQQKQDSMRQYSLFSSPLVQRNNKGDNNDMFHHAPIMNEALGNTTTNSNVGNITATHRPLPPSSRTAAGLYVPPHARSKVQRAPTVFSQDYFATRDVDHVLDSSSTTATTPTITTTNPYGRLSNVFGPIGGKIHTGRRMNLEFSPETSAAAAPIGNSVRNNNSSTAFPVLSNHAIHMTSAGGDTSPPSLAHQNHFMMPKFSDPQQEQPPLMHNGESTSQSEVTSLLRQEHQQLQYQIQQQHHILQQQHHMLQQQQQYLDSSSGSNNSINNVTTSAAMQPIILSQDIQQQQQQGQQDALQQSAHSQVLTPLFPKNKFILREHVATETWPEKQRGKLSMEEINRLVMSKKEKLDKDAKRIYREMTKFAQNENELHLEFTPKLTIDERNLIHKYAEQLGMDHYLRGIEPMRHLTVSKRIATGDEMQMIGYVGLFGHTVESIADHYANHIPQKYQMKRIKRDGPDHYIKIMEKAEVPLALKQLPKVREWDQYFAHPREKETFDEWPMCQRQQKLLSIIAKEIDIEDLHAMGLGELKSDHNRSKKRNHAYFVVVKWPSMHRIRDLLGLETNYCPHMTMGFFPRDVHDNNDKNESTITITETMPYPTSEDREFQMKLLLRFAGLDDRYARSIMNTGFTSVESLKSMRRIDMNAVGFNSELEKHQLFEVTSQLDTNMSTFKHWVTMSQNSTSFA